MDELTYLPEAAPLDAPQAVAPENQTAQAPPMESGVEIDLAGVPETAAEPTQPEGVCVVDVQFKSSGKVYFFDPGTLAVPDDTDIIIETARGAEFGHCVQGNHTVPAASVVQPLRPVVRLATQADRELMAEYRAKEPEALRICEEKVLRRGLDMKLVSAEYAFDGSKILFFFTSDGRVDFRDLVKDLAAVFRTRIELRQIGVRDEAKMLGGLGICGRPFCCAQFLDDFQPVSIKMAKTQALSLNPTKISGTCGRLMCCLKYEQDAYESLLKESPKTESLVDTPEGRGTITDIVLMRRQAKVCLQAHPDTVKPFSWDEITILRSGRARKDDPEIPLPPAPEPQATRPGATPKAAGTGKNAAAPATSASPSGDQPAPAKAASRKRTRTKPRTEEDATRTAKAPDTQPKPARAVETPAKPAKAAETQPAGEKKPAARKRSSYRKPYRKPGDSGSSQGGAT